MQLRLLEKKDAFHMLEWMHDNEITKWLSTNFASKELKNCLSFIDISQHFDTNINLAIVNDNDEYMGTVSLKHIDHTHGTAEFAITVRKCALGLGYSSFGMAQILNIGINELNLHDIYWCVSKKNTRAIRFYDKLSYSQTSVVPEHIKNHYTSEQNNDFIWYVVSIQ